MSLLQALGIDITVIAQFGIAATAFLILATAIFNAFQKSYLQRLSNTVGSQSHAEETYQKIEIVKQNYEQRAKALNQEIANIFDSEKAKSKEFLAEKQNQAKKDIEDLKSSSHKQMEIQLANIQSKKLEIVNDLTGSIYDQLVSQR